MKFKDITPNPGILFRRLGYFVFWCGPGTFPCEVCKDDTPFAIAGFGKIVYGRSVCSDECLGSMIAEET